MLSYQLDCHAVLAMTNAFLIYWFAALPAAIRSQLKAFCDDNCAASAKRL